MSLVCRDVTRLVSESMDRSLPFGKRIGVRIHLLICEFCARYERQLLLIRGIARRLTEEKEEAGGPPEESLSEEARERIRNSLRSP